MKRKNMVFAVITLLSPLLLTGCWNIKEIQDISYVTALGLDYQDGRYVAYAQMLDFSNVAKTEGGRPDKQPPIWIGKAEGITVTTALNNLYQDGQQRLYWGHVSTLLLSDRILDKGVEKSIDFINRYREIRYNILLFVTRESIEDLFRAKSFFTLSPLSTLLHEPTENYRQRSYVQPKQFFEFISDIREPGQTGYVPAISLTSNHWKEDQKPKELMKIDGAVFVRNDRLQGWLPESKLDGMRWMDPQSVRSPIWILEGGKPVASLVIENPKIKIKPFIKGDHAFFDIDIKVSGGINEKLKEIPEKELIRQAEGVIRKEVLDTYKEGVKIRADVYQLGVPLYRQDPHAWNRLSKKGAFVLNEESIQKVTVKLKLKNSGKLKYESR